HRLPIMPSEAVAQPERVLHAVRRHDDLIDHLRFDPKVLVRSEKGVVHKIAVVTRDVARRPNWIEDLQIGLRDGAEGLPVLLGVDRWRTQGHGGGRGSRASDDLSATDAVHPRVLSYRAAERRGLSLPCRLLAPPVYSRPIRFRPWAMSPPIMKWVAQ